jgi:hypothetical protein
MPEASMMMHIISLGAGVQSTTMALMAAHGEIEPMPDCAIFADTGDEPAAVYDHLAWLRSDNVLPFPVHVTSRGRLADRLMAGDDGARVPFFVGAGGMSKRQCTTNFKILPIRRKVRELLGVGPRGSIKPGAVQQWIGISVDEVWRVKPSGVQYMENRHPLVELRMRRHDCENWLTRNGYPIPSKSACVYCPYRSDADWRAIRDGRPEDWARACQVDAALREPGQVERFRGELYAHRSLKPLAVVDLSTLEDHGQLNMFNNECEGMCGV